VQKGQTENQVDNQEVRRRKTENNRREPEKSCGNQEAAVRRGVKNDLVANNAVVISNEQVRIICSIIDFF
jgi:hypothetical protein